MSCSTPAQQMATAAPGDDGASSSSPLVQRSLASPQALTEASDPSYGSVDAVNAVHSGSQLAAQGFFVWEGDAALGVEERTKLQAQPAAEVVWCRDAGSVPGNERYTLKWRALSTNAGRQAPGTSSVGCSAVDCVKAHGGVVVVNVPAQAGLLPTSTTSLESLRLGKHPNPLSSFCSAT